MVLRSRKFVFSYVSLLSPTTGLGMSLFHKTLKL